MKILREAKSQGWWVGKQLKCDCGFHAVVEVGDVEDNLSKRFSPMQAMIDYRCDCGRFVTLHKED